MKLDPKEQHQQEMYRDARISGDYEKIWQNVDKCAFCELNPKYMVCELDGMVLDVPLFAYIDGHMLIIPRRHVESSKELSRKEWAAVRKLLYIAKKMIKQVHGINGMQLVQKDGRGAQSTVGHLHFHCIPFDGPHLSTWNYRKLTYTPLENARLYKSKVSSLKHLSQKYDAKYKDGKKT